MPPPDTMTPERVVTLVVALAPVLSIVAGVIVVFIQKRYGHESSKEIAPPIGLTVDASEFADEAIASLKEQRDIYKERSHRSEEENRILRQDLRVIESENRDLRHRLQQIEQQVDFQHEDRRSTS